MQPLIDHREHERLAEADHEHRDRDGEDDPAQDPGRKDVPRPRGELARQVVLARRRRRLPDPQPGEAERGDRERDGVEARDHAAAHPGEQRRADQRREQAHALAERLEQRVGVPEQLLGDHHREERRLRRGEHRVAGAVEGGHDVEQPHVAAVVHQQQEEDARREHQIRHDHQRAPAHAIDEEAAERRERGRREDRQERQAGRRVRAGQRLRPHAEHEEHRAVAEGRQRLTRDEEPRVAVGEEPPHQDVEPGGGAGTPNTISEIARLSGGRELGSSSRS
ncbi:MAG: hypothetical protein JWN32_3354 [Solirubrobacterales bacterium]|nr:hypothetical protein [Solirubrobacterales bacterium]